MCVCVVSVWPGVLCKGEVEGVCLAACAYVCVYLAVRSSVCIFWVLSLFDLRKLRGGKGREG